MDKKIDLFSQVDFLVGEGGYSAFSIFSNTRECYRKNRCTRDFTVPKAYRGFWAASTEPPSVVLITISYQSKRAHHKGMLFCLAVANHLDAKLIFVIYNVILIISDFFFILFNINFSFGVLYLNASVGKMFKNKLTTATGNAMENAQMFGINNIGRKPIG